MQLIIFVARSLVLVVVPGEGRVARSVPVLFLSLFLHLGQLGIK